MRFVTTLAVVAITAASIVDGANLRGSSLSCSAPSSIYQGSVSYSGLTPGSTATYRCQSGCALSGPSTLRCNKLGSWSGAPPECRVIYNKKNDNSYKNNDKGYKLYSG